MSESTLFSSLYNCFRDMCWMWLYLVSTLFSWIVIPSLTIRVKLTLSWQFPLINISLTTKDKNERRIWTITQFHRWTQINLKLSHTLQHNPLQTIPVYPFLLNQHIISINSYFNLSCIYKSSLINTSLSIPFITTLINKLNIILNNHSTCSDFWW